MVAVRRTNPFRELAGLQERMNRIFDDTLASASRARGRGARRHLDTSRRRPRKEAGSCSPRSFPASPRTRSGFGSRTGSLTLDGERPFRKEADEARYHCVERSYGRFSRSFRLPANVDEEAISATFLNGLLVVELPKREEVAPKKASGSAPGATRRST